MQWRKNRQVDGHDTTHLLGCAGLVVLFQWLFGHLYWSVPLTCFLGVFWEWLDDANNRRFNATGTYIVWLDPGGGDYYDLIVDGLGIVIGVLVSLWLM